MPPVFLSGRSYCVRTQRMLNQCLESLVQKVQSGVVINFEKTGPDPPLVGEGELHKVHSLDPTSPVFKLLWTNLQRWQAVKERKKENVIITFFVFTKFLASQKHCRVYKAWFKRTVPSAVKWILLSFYWGHIKFHTVITKWYCRQLKKKQRAEEKLLTPITTLQI